VMPAHLHVISISPGTTADNDLELRLRVGGESQDQALDLVRKMESSNRFRQTRIDTEKVADQPGGGLNGNERVQFEIDALYTPSAEPSATSTSGGAN